MNNNQPVVELKDLSKRYGDKEVLSVDYMEIAKGCITCIIGPSGAGKSTLLRLMNLLEEPTDGEIAVFGRKLTVDYAARLALQQRMVMVFQKPVLLDVSVYDNIAYGLHARKFPKREIEFRVKDMLEKIGMSGQARQRAKTLSGGEAQRVAFARASVLRPELLLLDEATANLDPANVQLLEGMTRTLQQEYGTTVVMVTHNLFQARRLADEAVFLYQGRLIETGLAERFFAEPEMEETKAFIEGKMIY